MKIPIYNFLINSKVATNFNHSKLFLKDYSEFSFKDVNNDIFPFINF